VVGEGAVGWTSQLHSTALSGRRHIYKHVRCSVSSAAHGKGPIAVHSHTHRFPGQLRICTFLVEALLGEVDGLDAFP
jgi:hypothetical protein